MQVQLFLGRITIGRGSVIGEMFGSLIVSLQSRFYSPMSLIKKMNSLKNYPLKSIVIHK
jgi:hypothetical protein